MFETCTMAHGDLLDPASILGVSKKDEEKTRIGTYQLLGFKPPKKTPQHHHQQQGQQHQRAASPTLTTAATATTMSSRRFLIVAEKSRFLEVCTMCQAAAGSFPMTMTESTTQTTRPGGDGSSKELRNGEDGLGRSTRE